MIIKSSAVFSPKTFMFISGILILVGVYDMVSDIRADRVLWEVVLGSLTLPFFVLIFVLCTIDVFRKDHEIVRGRLVEKKGRQLVIETDNGERKLVGLHYEFSSYAEQLNVNQSLEIRKYRRFRSVIEVKEISDADLESS